MPVKVFKTTEDIIEVDYISVLEVADMKASQVDALKLANEAKAEGKKVLVLINTTEMKMPHAEERLYGLELLNTFPYDKVAVYGENKIGNFIIKMLVAISQTGVNVKLFDSKEAADAWLKE